MKCYYTQVQSKPGKLTLAIQPQNIIFLFWSENCIVCLSPISKIILRESIYPHLKSNFSGVILDFSKFITWKFSNLTKILIMYQRWYFISRYFRNKNCIFSLHYIIKFSARMPLTQLSLFHTHTHTNTDPYTHYFLYKMAANSMQVYKNKNKQFL